MAENGGLPTDRDDALNKDCFCITLDKDRLIGSIKSQASNPELAQALLQVRPHLFAEMPVFLAQHDLNAMLAVVDAVEAVAMKPAYQRAVLTWAPPTAQHAFGPRGVLMGYDFHVGTAGPKLIEVNTNAGGAFMNALLARAQSSCCTEASASRYAAQPIEFEPAVWRMFLAEWRLQGRASKPRTIAIVDDHPEQQYLYPEFLLAKGLFEREGLKAWIVDPSQMEFLDGRLLIKGETVDIVYNRLTDFSLGANGHEALRAAYINGAAVVTPNPRNHALFADKRNLSLMSEATTVASLGIATHQQQALLAVPRTVIITTENAPELWADRKDYFFKPTSGYGGKAVYRGDKVTHRVWGEILKGGYIAQRLAEPSSRRIKIDGTIQSLKLDVRLYTYAGELLLAAARVYQGQTTNFRTPGGGFAPVYIV